MEPITAYRWMHTDLHFEKNHYFQSIIHPHDWKAGWNECDLVPANHPGPRGFFGFYSYKNKISALGSDWLEVAGFSVLVSVSIAGTIVEHEIGYRSEFMRPDMILGWGYHVNGRMIRELRDRYDMDVAHINIVDGRKAATLFGLWPLWRTK